MKTIVTVERKIHCSEGNWSRALHSSHSHTSEGLQSFSESILEPEKYEPALEYGKCGILVSLAKLCCSNKRPQHLDQWLSTTWPWAVSSSLGDPGSLPLGCRYCLQVRRNNDNGGIIQWLLKLFLISGTGDLSSHFIGQNR